MGGFQVRTLVLVWLLAILMCSTTNRNFIPSDTHSYCPSVFILGPGQHVIINKGRLHMFRKVTLDPLVEDDCHNLQRKHLIEGLEGQGIKQMPICVSIAYDWWVSCHLLGKCSK